MARKRTSTPLQQAIKQTKAFRDRGQEALLDLLVTTDQLRRASATLLAPWDVTPQQYNVLRILRGAGPDGLPTLEIAERMLEKTPGITGLIDRIEKRGWVKRVRSTSDRRMVVCTATPAALRMLDEIQPVIDDFELKVTATLSDTEQAHLVRLLDRLRGGCGPGTP